MELYYQSAHQLHNLIQNREISITELVEAQLNWIDQVEDQIHAYIHLQREAALNHAQKLDHFLQQGEIQPGPLYGIPIAYKDNICTQGVITTCGSKMLADYIPPYNATVVERLEQTGMIMLGKTNLDEFAMGSSTETSAFFNTHNPWDVTRVPGGSSGGSAAAVAVGQAVISLGSDTGGSVRQPAAFCGVVGLKPTYGRVSRSGLVAYASSLDQIGPITRDVTDCALVMNVLAGLDSKDTTSASENVNDYTQALIPDVKGLKVGIPKEYFAAEVVDPEIVKKVHHTLRLLEQLGAKVEEFSMSNLEVALATYHMIASAEASSNLARFDGVRYGFRVSEMGNLEQLYCRTRGQGFGNEVKQRILLGTHALSSDCYEAYYLKAKKVWTQIRKEFAEAFNQYDILITPTTPTTAFRFNQKSDDLWSMLRSDLLTVSMNLAGVPAISVPIGFDSQGLPIGMQIVGKHFAESTLFKVAYTLEQELVEVRRCPRW